MTGDSGATRRSFLKTGALGAAGTVAAWWWPRLAAAAPFDVIVRGGTILDGGGCDDCNVLEVYGAPQGMTQRWERREYGPSLKVYFVSRLDQVHLKLLAASDPEAEPRHLEDLANRIRPTEAEVREAISGSR